MKINMKPLVLYHANCWDGFCAAWVARKRLGDIEAVPVQYGKPMPDVLGRNVFILDFSYPRKEVLAIHGTTQGLVILDHHKTAEEELAGLEFCTFSSEKSGGRLAWEFWYGSEPSPWLVDYIEDRDLWRHALPYSQAINAALRSYPLSFGLWDDFSTQKPTVFVQEGEAIRRREKQIVIEHTRNARTQSIAGYAVPVVNATVLFSEIAGELSKGERFGACYFDRQDGKRQWSLRSDENGLDVSAIAKQFGGGGHAHAAGYEESLAPTQDETPRTISPGRAVA